MLRFPSDAFRALCVADVELLARVDRLTGEVVQANEGTLRERERLACIGTLAAGLAHEINNPAAADGGVHVELADRGPGIPDALLARVWEPFFTTKPGAAGLGLDLARRVVAGHDGRIALGEREGGGTVVRVELPA